MGLFDLFKKKEKPNQDSENKILLAMPMFTNGQRHSLNDTVENLKTFWGLSPSINEGDNETAILTIDGESVAIAYLPVPIPMGDIEGTAQYAYNWPNVMDDLKDFSGHCIVSILSGQMKTVDKFKLLSKVLYSLLATSNSVGIYQGSQSLLIPKNQYMESAAQLKEGGLPINLWIYIGLRKSDSGNSLYTYGLSAFDKTEMEIINSTLSLDELYDFLSNICVYVIGSNVTFKNGETLGYTADQKIKLSLSKGQFVEGQSLKLEI